MICIGLAGTCTDEPVIELLDLRVQPATKKPFCRRHAPRALRALAKGLSDQPTITRLRKLSR